jgi:hypothetical protein
MLLALVLRVPSLLKGGWKDPLLRSVAVVLCLGIAIFTCVAPPSIVRINAASSIPNFAAVLAYSLLTATSAAIIHLMITWRGGPEAHRRRAARWCTAVYGSVIAALFTLFFLGDAPHERLRDLDTYYAQTPYIREMITVYLLAHTLAAATMTILCHRWYREVTGLLRAGLTLFAVGALCNLLYDACKLTAVVARWTGHNLDSLSTNIAPPVAGFGTLCLSAGYVLPSAGERIAQAATAWIQHRRLAPLARLTNGLLPGASIHLPWWSAPGVRHLQRRSDIRDGLRAIRPYIDQTEKTAALRALLAQGVGLKEAETRAQAISLVAARAVFLAEQSAHLATGQSLPEPPAEGDVIPDDPDSLQLLATALRTRTTGYQSAALSALD